MKVSWIKITVDIFSDEKIQIIDAMPESDSIFRIWIHLLTLAGKVNDHGLIYVTKDMVYTDEILSNIFRKPISVVRLALQTFERLGMIEMVKDGKIHITNWNKHQNLDGLDKIREQNRIRQKKHRDRIKSIENKKDITKKNNAKVTLRNETEESKKKKREEIEREEEKIRKIINHLNKSTNKHFKYSSKDTQKYIKARLKEKYSIIDFIKVIDYKVKEWINDSKMRQYLRPSTLFGTKFESYLNSIPLEKRKESDNPTIKNKFKKEYEALRYFNIEENKMINILGKYGGKVDIIYWVNHHKENSCGAVHFDYENFLQDIKEGAKVGR